MRTLLVRRLPFLNDLRRLVPFHTFPTRAGQDNAIVESHESASNTSFPEVLPPGHDIELLLSTIEDRPHGCDRSLRERGDKLDKCVAQELLKSPEPHARAALRESLDERLPRL